MAQAQRGAEPAGFTLAGRNVGVIGLGIMGANYARHLLEAGFEVCGYDIAPECRQALQQAGGKACASAADVVAAADVVITALSSIAAFRSVMLDGDTAVRARARQLYIETGTLPLDLKEQARARLQAAGAAMIDAPVTGTRIHAERKELSVYASGSEAAVRQAMPFIEAFARDVHHVGPFGAGIKLKMVTNHLVAVHNVATAEALALASLAGLDLAMVHRLIAGGPAASGVFGFRGPLMVEQRYEPPTMRMDVFQKDLEIIDAFAREVHARTPLFDAGTAIYRSALDQGSASEDVAAVFRVLSQGL